MLLIYFFQFLLSAHLAEAHEDCGNLCAGCCSAGSACHWMLTMPLATAHRIALRCISADESCIREAVELPSAFESRRSGTSW